MTISSFCVIFFLQSVTGASPTSPPTLPKDSGISEDSWTYFLDDDISFADDVVVLDHHGHDFARPNDVSKIIWEEYEYIEGTADIQRMLNIPTNAGALERVSGIYAVPNPLVGGPDALLLYGGKAYACRVPIGGMAVDAVSHSVLELYHPDMPHLGSLYIQNIPIIDHLIDESDDEGVWSDSSSFQTDDGSCASVDCGESPVQPSQTEPSREGDAFSDLFKRFKVRDLGWIYLEDQLPVPFYKWHVSNTRISSFGEQVTREHFFTDKLKIPWNHLVDKFRTSRQRIVINDSSDRQSTLDNAPARFWDRIAAKAFPNGDPAYWKHLVDSFARGSDSLQLVKHSNYYSNLMPGGRVPLTGGTAFFKAGPRVNYDGKVTLKIARNLDGSFDVNYSFLRGWDVKAVLAAGFGIKQLKGLGGGLGAVIIRPYKNQREWNFVRSSIPSESVAEVLESFADNTLTDMSSLTGDWTGNWKIMDGADVSSGVGIGYNLLKGQPSVAFAESPEGKSSASFGAELPLLFGNVGVTRTRVLDPATGEVTDTKWKVSATGAAENTIQTYWTIEPPEVGPIQDDGTVARIKGDTEDGGQRALYARSVVLNEQNRLIDLVTKKKPMGESLTLDYKPTFQGRGFPQFTNPVKKKFGVAFYEELLMKAQETVEFAGQDFDKRILSFNIVYTLSDEAKQDLIAKHKALNIVGWEAGVDKDRKTILTNPEMHREKMRLNVSMTASKEYKKGGTFGLPFLGRQKDGAEIAVTQKYQLLTDHALPPGSLVKCMTLGATFK
eukprot:GEMP01008143.1.p1 GENE.GEMP01008143.1~~GEMP01008143.1.p1  ORF type:complete len:779 (+),score=123.87 GEMP01008143.1:76-2412(+)